VAHGVADDAWTPAVQEHMAHRLGARHEVIPGAIHSPAIENPARTVEVLLSFWASVPAAGRSAEDAGALR
jgi:pimeloyl-ACP methyl ester carboxylesterase